jgi:purine-binding chemotaxis protein CheW
MNDHSLVTSSDASRQVCTFRLDGVLFGVDVRKVQEVLRAQEMTRIPLAPHEVRGLINLRGQIVTAIDLRARLGLPARDEDAPPPMNVVVQTEDGATSLLVDEIGDVVEVDEATFERPPETLARRARELVRGVYKLQRQLLLLLDTERAIAVSSPAATSTGGPR